MSYSSTTTYLGLRDITLNDENWLADSRYNNQKIDVIAKHMRLQVSPGASLGIRYELASGTLVEAISVDASSGSVITLNVGRVGDTVKVAGYAPCRWLGSINATTTTIVEKEGDLCRDTNDSNKIKIYANAAWVSLT